MTKTRGSAVLIAILLFIILVGAFSFMEYSRHQSLLIQEKTNKTERLLYYLEDYIKESKDHLLLIASLWKGQQPSSEQKEMLLGIAEEMINLFPAYRFIHLIDSDLVIRHSAPKEEAKRVGLIGKDTSQDSENIIMLEKMIETHRPLISPVIWREVSEAYGAHIWVPILEGSELLGIISGDLDLSYIISKKILKTDLSNHSLRINASNIDIFETDDRQIYPVEVTHEIMDTPWTIGVYSRFRMSPSIVFLSGTLLSFLVSFSVYKTLIKNRYLKETKDELQDRRDALYKSEQKLDNILTNVPDAIWSISWPDMSLLYYNDYAKKLYGLDSREFNHELLREITHPEDQYLIDDAIEKLKKDGYVEQEFRIVHPDGEIVWIQDRARLIVNEDNTPLRVDGIATNITDSKQAEEALIKSEKRLITMMNNTPDMVVRFSTDLQHIYCNDAVERELGIPTDYFIGRSILDIPELETEKVKSMHQCLVKCLETGEKQYYNTEYMTPSGLKHYSTIIIPERHNEKIESLLAVTRDITDMRMAEDKLRLQSLVFNQIQDRVTVTDLNGVITYVNDAEAQALGYPREELIGATIEKFGEDPEQGATQREIIEETLKCGTWRGEVVNKTLDGREIYMDCRTQVVLDDQGNSIALAGIATDITERKQMEEKIQYQHDFQKVVANISYSFINTPRSWIDESINYMLSQIGTFFNVDRTYFFQFSSDNQSLSNTYEWCNDGIEQQIGKTPVQPVDKLPWFINEIRWKEYVFISDVSTLESKKEREEFQRQGIQSLICIPLKLEKRVVGFIRMDSVTEKMAWTEEEITLLKVIVEIMSSAFSKHQVEQELIHRSQEVEQLNHHLNQEIEKAHQIHSNILPKEFPSIKGISFAAFYQPAEKLGGDFYGVIQEKNKLVVYLSDISGHGLDGSMINFFVKEVINSYITLKPDESSPKSILRHLEQQFRQEDYPDEIFICIFLAVLDLETMELTYAGAGFQDTPFVRQGNGEQAILSTKELFINSIFPIDKNSFQEKTISLTKGSTIFFNTDGITEQGQPGSFYKDRLPQVFYENAYLPPDGISQVVLEDFRQFNNGSLQGDDDITFLILKVDPENRVHQFELETDFDELESLRNKAVEILATLEESDVLINSLYELVANAMEHGNRMDPTKKVLVEFVVSDEYMQASVEDEGAGFNWRDKMDKPLELEGHTDRGRGIAMIRILCHSLFYNDQGNKATCIVKFGQGVGA